MPSLKRVLHTTQIHSANTARPSWILHHSVIVAMDSFIRPQANTVISVLTVVQQPRFFRIGHALPDRPQLAHVALLIFAGRVFGRQCARHRVTDPKRKRVSARDHF